MTQKISLSNPSRIENFDDEIVLARQILPNMYAFILAVLSDKSISESVKLMGLELKDEFEIRSKANKGKRKGSWTKEQEDTLVRMREQGYYFSDIGKVVGKHGTTCQVAYRRVCRERGIEVVDGRKNRKLNEETHAKLMEEKNDD